MKIWRVLIVALAVALMPAAALAASSEHRNVLLAKSDHRTGNYYVAGQTVTVDGDVDGDVICAGQTVVINGAVGGDVLCAAQSLTINGRVGGSVRVVGQTVAVNGPVGRNVTAAGQDLALGSDAAVSGEIAAAGQSLTLNGPVAHAAYLAGNDLNLRSTIGGDLNYVSQNTQSIDKSKVGGQVIRHTAPNRTPAEPTPGQRLAMLLYWIVAALGGALLMIWLAPRLVRAVTGTMIRRWGPSLGWGLLALIAGPAVFFVLALTVIGLPTAGVLFVLWILALVTAGLFSGMALGQLIRGQAGTNRSNLILGSLIGVPALVIIGWLPVIGALVGLASAAWALGGLILAANRMRVLG